MLGGIQDAVLGVIRGGCWAGVIRGSVQLSWVSSFFVGIALPVQDSKSTMILILELVRGGELFDLISSNSSSKRKNERGNGSGSGGGANGANELHEVTMR